MFSELFVASGMSPHLATALAAAMSAPPVAQPPARKPEPSQWRVYEANGRVWVLTESGHEVAEFDTHGGDMPARANAEAVCKLRALVLVAKAYIELADHHGEDDDLPGLPDTVATARTLVEEIGL